MRRNVQGWVVSAYGIARAHGYAGTEREFRLSLLGRDGIFCMPMVLVTDADEADVPAGYEAYMAPSDERYAYATEKNAFLAADKKTEVPDGLDVDGRTLRLSCGGVPFGQEALLPGPGDVLPPVKPEDDGKVLKVVNGAWTASEA